MGLVWDRTVDVLQGRTGILARLAMLYLFLPGVVGAGVRALATPGSALALVAVLVSLASSVLLILGVLAITAVASDPAVDARRASALGAKRLLPALGAIALVVAAAVIVLIPISLLIVRSGAVFDPATGRFDLSGASGASLNLAGAITLVALVAGLWLSAKLVPLLAVIVSERLGFAAFTRSFRLTRGSTLRLVGVIILYAIVVLVAIAAATSVTGVVAGLLLGGDAAGGVAFVVGVVSAALTALTTVVQAVFYARFYVAARETADPAGGTTASAAATDAPLPR